MLDGVSFSIGHEAVCVVGRNGMGKSTLCNTIMGLVAPTAGSIRFDGTDIAGMAPEQVARRGIAYVPQGRRLFPSLTVDEHLRMLARKAPRQTMDARGRLRTVPAPRRASPQRRRRAVGRRAADARCGACAAAERSAGDHGRAIRGSRPDDRRHADRRDPPARGRGRRRARRRAEPPGRDRDRRSSAGHGVGPDRNRDHRRRRSPTIPNCNAATWGSTHESPVLALPTPPAPEEER